MLETSSSLVRGITDFQDHQSWFEFNHRYRPMIRKLLTNKGLRQSDLDDAVQDVYVSMLSTLDQFRYDRQKGKFRGWLSTVTQRAVSARRRRRGDISIDPKQLDESLSAEVELPKTTDDRLQLCLSLARSRFDQGTWLPFYLRVIEETPIEEVQRITQMNRNAIYQAVHRVKKCLAEMIKHLEADQDSRPIDD